MNFSFCKPPLGLLFRPGSFPPHHLAFSSHPPSSFLTEDILSSQSKEKCIARIRKMKPMRPVKTAVKQEAAVLVPLVDLDGSPGLLFTRRSLSLSSHSGQVSFPGGKVDPGDRDLVDTACRETMEELGIPTTAVDVWCQMPALSSNQRGDYSATPVVGFIRDFSSLQLRLSEAEVSSVFCVPISSLCSPSNHGYTQFRVSTRPGYSLPVYHGAPHVIWGLTAIITFQFLRALLPAKLYNHKLLFQSPMLDKRQT